MSAQILINCGNNWFEFSKSRTGQIDYLGKWEKNEQPKVEGWQEISSSTYFTPAWYSYIQDGMNNNPKVYIAPGVDVSDKEIFSYLVHIGPLLSAIEAKDSFLAGELYLRRQYCFEKFSQLTAYILEPLCVEILFSLCFGKMKEADPDTIPLIFNNAKKKLHFNTAKETLQQAFIRYMKENEVVVTLPLVGTNFYSWDAEPEVLEKLTDNLGCDNILEKAEKIRKAKHDLYAGLETSVQAEPYNKYDNNSILVCIENIDSKISGNPGLEKAGHIRALAAKIIREAKQEKMNYSGKLVRVGYDDIVVQMMV